MKPGTGPAPRLLALHWRRSSPNRCRLLPVRGRPLAALIRRLRPISGKAHQRRNPRLRADQAQHHRLFLLLQAPVGHVPRRPSLRILRGRRHRPIAQVQQETPHPLAFGCQAELKRRQERLPLRCSLIRFCRHQHRDGLQQQPQPDQISQQRDRCRPVRS